MYSLQYIICIVNRLADFSLSNPGFMVRDKSDMTVAFDRCSDVEPFPLHWKNDRLKVWSVKSMQYASLCDHSYYKNHRSN